MDRKLLCLIILSCVAVFSVSDTVYAGCSSHPLAGYWKARHYTKLSPNKIEIIHNCNAASYRGGTARKPEWVVRVFHRCRPRDCIWGRAKVKRYLSGVLEARFETFSARRYIKIIPFGLKIEVRYVIDYRSELRKDLKGRVYMTR